jgi:hypothetical protein
MAFEMILVHVILPLSPLIAMTIGCLVEWLISKHR